MSRYTGKTPGTPSSRGTGAFLSLGLMLVSSLSGCSIFSRYDLGAIPVNRVPRQILTAELKDDYEDISPLRLRQDQPENYILGPGDVLGIYINGVLGGKEDLPPVNFPEDASMAPAIGFPVPIREDGTVELPLVDPVQISGMTLVDATNVIQQAFRYPKELVAPDNDRTIVTLMRKRKVRVLVVREESGGVDGVSKRGTGHVVDLPAGENDVLHALSETGGMPGTDAKNEILIYRGMFSDGMNYDSLVQNLCMDNCQDPCFCNEAPVPDPPHVTRIPLRYNPANPPIFSQDDIVLNNGDIIIIRSRDNETFVTAGLLGGGEYPLPRDKDLDIIGAIAMTGGPLGSIGTGVGGIGGNRGGGGGFGGVGGRGVGGGGYCQPSEAIVIRELPCGDQIAMKVDLNKALTDPSQRILIKPNDVIMLRYTLEEEIGNVVLNLFQFNFLLNGFSGNGF